MARARQNHDRESRIHEEIIVDTYGLEEQAMSWYYYLEDKLQFPFHAQCVASVPTSPLRKGDTIEIRKMAAEDTLLLMEDKKTLAEILERFNRKERNLLIRHILDC